VLANAASLECVIVVDGGAPLSVAPGGVTVFSACDVLRTGSPGIGASGIGASGRGTSGTEATASGRVGPGSVPEFHDPAVILFTSGTTGPSKPVIVPWGQLQVTAQGTFVYDDLDETDVFYAYSPPSHIGTKTWVYLAALVGGGVVLRPAFRTGEFLADVRRFGITSAGLVGAMAHFLMGSPERPDDADIPLRNVVMAPLLPDPAQFCRRFGVRLYTAFGMTELSIPIRGDGWSTENPAAAGKGVVRLAVLRGPPRRRSGSRGAGRGHRRADRPLRRAVDDHPRILRPAGGHRRGVAQRLVPHRRPLSLGR
jgi:acyl-CoA synthetase (AMP-forming)/AMP-acid ligase II